jgi:hypothetical protein
MLSGSPNASEAGDLIQAEQSGAFSWDDLAAETGVIR